MKKILLFFVAFLCFSLIMKAQTWFELNGNPDRSRYSSYSTVQDITNFGFSIKTTTNVANIGTYVGMYTGNVIGDFKLELISMAINSTETSATVYIHDNTGTLYNQIAINGDKPRFGMLGDVNGDGLLEIGIGVRNSSFQIENRFYNANGTIIKNFVSPAAGYDGYGRPSSIQDGKVICDISAYWALNPRGFVIFDIATQTQQFFYGTGTYTNGTSVRTVAGNKYYLPYECFSPNNGASIVANGVTNTDLSGMSYILNSDFSTKLRKDHGYISPYSGGSITTFFVKTTTGHKLFAARHRGTVYYQGQSSIWEMDLNNNGNYLKTYNGDINSGFVIGVADINNDGNEEIIYTTTEGSNYLYILDKDLNVLKKINQTGTLAFINDFLGKGSPQIYLYDGGYIRAFDNQLNQIWNYGVGGSVGSAIVSDLNMDGINEIIVQMQYSTRILRSNAIPASVSFNNTTLSVGTPTTIDIKTNLTTSDNIISYQFDYNYDKTKLQYQSATTVGTWAEGGSVQINSTTAGKLSVAWARTTPIASAGSILKLNFMPINKGITTPTITNAFFNTTAVNSISNGILTVNIRYGDVDMNTVVQAYDAALALQKSVGYVPSIPIWDSYRTLIADVDGDISITAYDASLILKQVAGLITKFPVEGGKKGGSLANVKVAIENNEIVFRSIGDVSGLNVFANESANLLGEPIVDQTMMSATNINSNTYAIGLATANPATENIILVKIPFKSTGIVTLNLIANTNKSTVVLDLSTGISAEVHKNEYSIFPNPVRNELNISGLKGKSKLRIYDLNGKLVRNQTSTSNQERIDVSGFTNGIYTLSIETKEGISNLKFVKQ